MISPSNQPRFSMNCTVSGTPNSMMSKSDTAMLTMNRFVTEWRIFLSRRIMKIISVFPTIPTIPMIQNMSDIPMSARESALLDVTWCDDVTLATKDALSITWPVVDASTSYPGSCTESYGSAGTRAEPRFTTTVSLNDVITEIVYWNWVLRANEIQKASSHLKKHNRFLDTQCTSQINCHSYSFRRYIRVKFVSFFLLHGCLVLSHLT